MGDWWTPLVMREAFFGRRRFEEFQSALDVPRAVLTARLNRLCDEGMLERVAYQDHPARHEYRLTDKGRAFWDVLAAMWRWGTDWQWPDGRRTARRVEGPRDRAVVQPVVIDEHTGERLDVRRLRVGRPPRALRDKLPPVIATWLTEQFGLTVPIVAAPMSGAANGPFAAAVCRAGGLGMIGISAQSPDDVRARGGDGDRRRYVVRHRTAGVVRRRIAQICSTSSSSYDRRSSRSATATTDLGRAAARPQDHRCHADRYRRRGRPGGGRRRRCHRGPRQRGRRPRS